MEIKSKKIVLTGGTGGIGKYLAELLCEEGGDILVVSRKGEDIAGRGSGLKCDLSTDDGINNLCKKLSEEKVDILINLAGFLYFGHFEKQEASNLANILKVNLEAPMRLSQAVIPHMLEQKSGKIVNIGSVFGAICFPHFVTYSTTKAGLKGFSEALRREYMGKGISVSHIAPRAVETSLNGGIISELHKKTKTVHDDPQKVARIIFNAIKNDKENAIIGVPEAFFARFNSIFPSVIDKALIEKRDIAEKLINL